MKTAGKTNISKAFLASAVAGVMTLMPFAAVTASAAVNANSFTDMATLSDNLAATDTIYPIGQTAATFNLGPGGQAWYLKENLQADLSKAAFADFYQYSITNNSDAPTTLSIGYIATNLSHNLFLSADKAYSYRDENETEWTIAKTVGENAVMTIPANFNGSLRIPVTAYDITKTAGENPVVVDWGANLEYSLRDAHATAIVFLVSAGSAAADFTINGLSVVSMGNTNDFASDIAFYGTVGGQASGAVGKTMTVSFDEGTNSKAAEYIQVKICNYAPAAIDLFFITLNGSKIQDHSNGYQIQLQRTGSYQMYNFAEGEWSEAEIGAAPSYVAAPCGISVPAGFDGLLRIPMASFRAMGGASDWVIDSNYITGFQCYMTYPNVGWEGNLKLGNITWIDADAEYSADGDVNGDGAVNIIDLIRAKKVYSGADAVFRAAGLDNDGNGSYDATDISALSKAIING